MTAKPKQNNQLGIKFLLTTFSLTLALGFWNMFARKAQPDQNGSNQDITSVEPWEDANSFVLPTLVPLEWPSNGNNSAATGETGLPDDIREVTAPTPRPIVQQQAPVVENVTLGQPSSPEQPRPQPTSVTSTGSSQ